jgi:hypothetical protein
LIVDSPAWELDGSGDELVIASLVGTETVVSSKGTSVPTVVAGKVTFPAGTCWYLELSNGSLYIAGETSGVTAFDVSSNGADGAWNTGGGGLATLYSALQPDDHYFAENGGTAVIVCGLDGIKNGAIAAQSITQGTGKALKMRVKIEQFVDYDLFTSAGKLLEATWELNHTVIRYDGGAIGTIFSGWGWVDVEAVVDVGPSMPMCTASSGNVAIEFAYATLEDNGGWSASSYDGGSYVYNVEYPSLQPFTSNDCKKKYYPALASGLDDVDGAGLQNPPETTLVHNGGPHKVQQALNRDYGDFNGATSVGGADGSSLGAGDLYIIYAGRYKTQPNGYNPLFANGSKVGGAGVVFQVWTFNNKDFQCAIQDGVSEDHALLAPPAVQDGEVIVLSLRRTGMGANNCTATFLNLDTGASDTEVFTSTLDALLPSNKVSFGAFYNHDTGLYGNFSACEPFYGAIGTDPDNIIHTYNFDGWDGVSPILDGVGTNDMTLSNVTSGTTTTPLPLAFGTDIGQSKLYSPDGVTFDKVSYIDYLQWVSNSDYNTWVKYTTGCFIDDVVIVSISDGDDLDDMVDWLGNPSCGGGVLKPIVYDGEYVTYDGELVYP